MGVKISELPVISSANANDSLVLNHGGATRRITLENLIQAGKIAAQLLTAADLEACLEFYVSEGHLTDVLEDYLSANDMPEYLSEFVTSSDLQNAYYVTESYLSEVLADYISADGLSETLSNTLSDYVSSGALEELLSGYITSAALSEILDNYASKSYLDHVLAQKDYLTSDSLSGYVSQSDVSSYLSEGLAGLGNLLSAADLEGGGYVSSSNFAAALGAYLEEYGGETIYDAISQYIHQEG
jgi:hypothetical protein